MTNENNETRGALTGWKLVPTFPTRQMVADARVALGDNADVTDALIAAIAAAPTASAQQVMGSDRLTDEEILRRAEGMKFDDEGGADRLVAFVRSLSLPAASAQQDEREVD